MPTRDPHTGETTERFRETFIKRRGATLPAWADRGVFDSTLCSVTVGTRVPGCERGSQLRVGEESRVG